MGAHFRDHPAPAILAEVKPAVHRAFAGDINVVCRLDRKSAVSLNIQKPGIGGGGASASPHWSPVHGFRPQSDLSGHDGSVCGNANPAHWAWDITNFVGGSVSAAGTLSAHRAP